MKPEEKKTVIRLEKAVNEVRSVIHDSNEYPSSYYPRSSGRFWPIWRDLLKVAPGRLLDLGCGVGFLSSVASRLGFEVHCLDAVKSIKNEAIQKFNLRFSLYNIESTPLPYIDSSFDVVLLTEVLEHFIYSPLVPLNEIRRVLKPGGRLFLTTPNVAGLFYIYRLLKGGNVSIPFDAMISRSLRTQNSHDREFRDTHFRCYNISEIRKLMKMAGFSTLKYRSLVRGNPATRNIPRKLFLFLAKTNVALTNSRIWGDTIYIIAQKNNARNRVVFCGDKSTVGLKGSEAHYRE